MLLRGDLLLTDHICNDPIFREVHMLRFWEMGIWGAFFNLGQPCSSCLSSNTTPSPFQPAQESFPTIPF